MFHYLRAVTLYLYLVASDSLYWKSLKPVKLDCCFLFSISVCIQCQKSLIKHSFGEEELKWYLKNYGQIVKDIKCCPSLKLISSPCIKFHVLFACWLLKNIFLVCIYSFSNIGLFGTYLKIEIEIIANILTYSTYHKYINT